MTGQGRRSRAFADLCQVSDRGRRGRSQQEPREEGEVQYVISAWGISGELREPEVRPGRRADAGGVVSQSRRCS